MASSSFYSGTGVTPENTDVTPVEPSNISTIEDSKNAASLSEAAAAASATAAATSATAAAASESTAATNATAAAASESTAATSESNASTSEANAASSASSAQASKDAALAALDSFDDRYLGPKATDPTVDNDGDALIAGALYFNTTDDVMKVYDGLQWADAYASLPDVLLADNNLSDLSSASASRTNLGLGTAATTASTDYATAAQGALADTAIQPNDDISALTNDAGYTTNVGDITGVTAGSGISGGGTSGTVTINHADTSSQESVDNSGTTVIQDVTLDTYGHVTGLSSTTLTIPTAYTNNDVDTHLNTNTATADEYLKWTGSDYDWATVPAGYTDSDVDAHLNYSTATTGQVLSYNGSDYDWVDAGGGSVDGLGFTGGSYNSSTGVVTFASDDGLGFSTGDLRGADGTSYTDSDVDTHLNTSAATTGEVLSWTGTDYDWIAAGGGGGADLYAANEVTPTAQPSATGSNAVAIGDSAAASGSNAIAVGYNSNASNTGAVAFTNSAASGNDSLAAAIANNSTSYGATQTSAIAIGSLAKATKGYSVGIGRLAAATGSWAYALGQGTTASGTPSHVLGHNSSATADNSVSIGSSVTNSTANQIAIGGSSQQLKISSAYTLPTTDGTNGQVLTTDGSGAVTFADAGGGGGDTGTDYNDDVKVRFGTGNDLEIYHDGTTNNSYIKETNASGHLIIQGQEIQFDNAAGTSLMNLSGSQIEMLHGGSKKLETTSSGIQTTGTVNVNGAYTLPTSDGTNGQVLTTDGSGAVTFADAGGGGAALELYAENPASPTAPSATGTNAVAIGNGSTASQPHSVALGRQSVADKVGKFAFSSYSLASVGQSQTGMMVLVSSTTDATPKALTTDNSGAATINQVILPNNSAYAFHGTIVARQQASAGTASAAWKIEGLIRREGSAGTTVLVNSATTVLDNTPAWGMALSADTTNGGLKVEATGAAATNTRWVATIHTSEVTYA